MVKKILKFIFSIFIFIIIISWESLQYSKFDMHNCNVYTIKIPKDSVAQLYIIGTVHKETLNYNGDSIYNVLCKIKPDLILLEIDSSNFDKHFKLRQTLKHRLGVAFGFGKEENEEFAVKKFIKLYTKTFLRPYEFEGRDEFHKKNKILLKPKEVFDKLEVLYKEKKISNVNAQIWESWISIDDSLSLFRGKSISEYNSSLFYKVSEKRQFYQYQKINEIIQSEPDLTEYRIFYQTNSDFWNIRNKSMVQHIKKFVELFPNKKIVVLTGASHKYFLVNELKKEVDLKLDIVEFFD